MIKRGVFWEREEHSSVNWGCLAHWNGSKAFPKHSKKHNRVIKREIGAVIFTRTSHPSSFDLPFPSPTAQPRARRPSSSCVFIAQPRARRPSSSCSRPFFTSVSWRAEKDRDLAWVLHRSSGKAVMDWSEVNLPRPSHLNIRLLLLLLHPSLLLRFHLPCCCDFIPCCRDFYFLLSDLRDDEAVVDFTITCTASVSSLNYLQFIDLNLGFRQ